MPTFHPFQSFPPLQRVILERARGTITAQSYGPARINAELESVAAAVESAYILTPKDELPKVVEGGGDKYTRVFTFAGQSQDPVGVMPTFTAAKARLRAAAWLAIARHLDAEEKAASDAAAKAETARKKRLDELADQWFGKDFADLGDNKAAAIKEIHRLEQLTEDKDAA